jgi:hypothetical protein
MIWEPYDCPFLRIKRKENFKEVFEHESKIKEGD